MRLSKIYSVSLLLAMTALVAACGHKAQNGENATQTQPGAQGKPNAPIVFKGIYSYAPGAKLFQFCGQKSQFWAIDSSAQLELNYTHIYNFEQSGLPVYAEVEGYKTKSESNGDAAAYDSTIVVKKVLKLTKDIPAGCK